MSEITSLIMDGVVKASVQGTPATLQAQGLSPDTSYNTKIRYEKDGNVIESSVQGIRTLPAGTFSVSNTYIENDASTGHAILTFDFLSTYAISSIQVRYSGVDYQGSIVGGKCSVELPTGLQYTSINFDISAIDIYTESFRISQTGVYVEEAMSKQPFFVQLIDPTENQGNVQINQNGTPTALNLEYSTDGSNWDTYTIGNNNIPLTSSKPRVWFRNTSTTRFSTGTNNYYKVILAGMSVGGVEVGGNIASLKSKNLSDTTSNAYDFVYLFNNQTSIGKADRLYLGNYMTLVTYCYYCMFYRCTSLTKAPELPATTLAFGCYSYIFGSCTSLTKAPELPATSLALSCYRSMFHGCTSLNEAPKLPATSLASECYRSMFHGCTSLTEAPKLPATTLANQCYYDMFQGCTSLTTAPKLPATTLAPQCYYNMFNGCTSLTEAPKLPATSLASECYYGMFMDCTSLTEAPELPATSLASKCYLSMFDGCSSLEKAPELPAKILVSECYTLMFNLCTNLKEITCLAEDISASNCVIHWVYGVAQSGTFIKSPNMSSWPTGMDGIPSGWTVQDYQ